MKNLIFCFCSFLAISSAYSCDDLKEETNSVPALDFNGVVCEVVTSEASDLLRIADAYSIPTDLEEETLDSYKSTFVNDYTKGDKKESFDYDGILIIETSLPLIDLINQKNVNIFVDNESNINFLILSNGGNNFVIASPAFSYIPKDLYLFLENVFNVPQVINLNNKEDVLEQEEKVLESQESVD